MSYCRVAPGHPLHGPYHDREYGFPVRDDAAIENARRIVALQEAHGAFAAWLDARHPLSRAEWVALFKRTFRFTGGEITGEFLLSTGYLPGAHDRSCPVFAWVARRKPPWMRG